MSLACLIAGVRRQNGSQQPNFLFPSYSITRQIRFIFYTLRCKRSAPPIPFSVTYRGRLLLQVPGFFLAMMINRLRFNVFGALPDPSAMVILNSESGAAGS